MAEIEEIRDETYELLFDFDLSESIIRKIEEGIFNASENSIMYYTILSIKVLQNLKNDYVIKNIKSGVWKAESIANLDKDILNPEKWQELQDIRLPKNIKKERKKGVNKCKKCGSWYTTFTQAQTRSADESITTFVNCEDCSFRYKIN